MAAPPTGPLCVFVTLEDASGHVIDDDLCEPAFAARGWRLEHWPWTADRPWSSADLLVLRSCYDYWLRPAQFDRFLADREAEGVRLINPASLVRWNSNKRYLADLEALGLPVIPSLVVERGMSVGAVRTFLAAHPEAEEWVIKPLVGSGGFDMRKLPRGQVDEDDIPHGSILQPFLSRIYEGEWSAIFLGGKPSHAVLKRATGGEYRVQDSHGGVTSAISWDDRPGLREHAERAAVALTQLGLPYPCYARYDFIGGREESQLLLMEVEAIEPTLFLLTEPQAPERLVEAILSYHTVP